MYRVICKEEQTDFETLDLAMAFAKLTNEFVTIKGGLFEIVGIFGVAYDWNKASRIGRVKRERV
jgi:hypothetical protein